MRFPTETLDTTKEILKRHRKRLDDLRLKVGKGAVFTVRVNGDVVWSSDRRILAFQGTRLGTATERKPLLP